MALLIGICPSRLEAQITLPAADPRDAIQVQGRRGQSWREGRYEVWILDGAVRVLQGDVVGTADTAVIWIDRQYTAGEEPTRMLAYLEGNVRLDFGRGAAAHRSTGRQAQTIEDRRWFGRFHTFGELDVRVDRMADLANTHAALHERAWTARDDEGTVRPAQFSGGAPPHGVDPVDLPPPFPPPAFPPLNTAPGPAPLDPAVPGGEPSRVFLPTLPGTGRAAGGLRPPPVKAGIKKLESRGSGGFNVQTFNGPDGNVAGFLIDSGVRLVLDSLENAQFQGYKVQRIDLETDRIVVWGPVPQLQLGEGGPSAGSGGANDDRPLEVYMEGNIIFREGDRVIYADRMYYNVTQHYGVVLKGEMLTPVPEYKGLLRLKADAIQMLNEQKFQAYGAALTSSRMGVPRYWFQSDSITFEDQQQTRVDPFSGLPAMDSNTGEPAVDHKYQATSNNNWIYLSGVPVFYWPTIHSDLSEPSYYLQRAQLNSDKVFGTQVLLDWDLYQLLGIRNRIPGSKWQLSTDYLSKRGPGLGSLFEYGGDNFLGIPGPHRGVIDVWGISDSGTDNLGIDRRALIPPQEFRGRAFAQHRQRFGDGYQFTLEFSALTDNNFLEQYFEQKWDQNKDETTGIELKRLVGNASWSVAADARLNKYFTQTESLPRLDHFRLGESLFNDRLTWNEHSNIAYMQMRTASTPTDPTDAAKFQLMPWEVNQEGLRAVTRQELDLPLQLGVVKFVPYVLGEAAYWGNDINGDPLTRLYGQAGVRATLPMWAADNAVQSELWNVNGIAHKVTWTADLSFSEANQDLTRLPLFDPVDDDSTEHFRRRLFFNTFAGVAPGNVPNAFDERFYALRYGLQNWVTAPTEIADDLMLARLGVLQRWQTKRGLPGQQRIVDWIVLNAGVNLYPDPDRDDFGKIIGMIDYDFRWHLGDRFTLLSDGYADMFNDGLQTISLGGLISRPGQGSMYLGFRTMTGPQPAGALTPLDSQILTANLNYRMSEKWIFTGGATYDFGPGGNHGQSASVVRVGESFLLRAGATYDFSRNNFGVQLSIEPRFLPNNRLGRIAGAPLPPAGALGLE